MSDEESQEERDEYKINTVIAARRAFERSEERDQQQPSGRRRQTDRNYDLPAPKYCPCCRDKVSTMILLCNSGLMTVTSQVAVISTIYIATTGESIVPGGLIAVFLLTCFAISVFGLCGMIGPVRKTFSDPPLTGRSKTGSNFCILSYMVANFIVLFIFFISLCFCLSFLSRSAVLHDVRAWAAADADELVYWINDFVTSAENVEKWKEFESVRFLAAVHYGHYGAAVVCN